MIILLAVLLTACAGSSEITLTKAELSSNSYNDRRFGSLGIDGDPDTKCTSKYETNPSLRVTFAISADVGKVVLVKGWNTGSYECIYQASVYRGPWKTPCGSFTTANGVFDISIQCGGLQGDSVLFEQYGCNGYIDLGEIKVYSFINARITIANASQSGNFYSDRNFAADAFDNDNITGSTSARANSAKANFGPAWFRGYFETSTEVDNVDIYGYNTDGACVYQVSVLTGEEKTPCGGTFTKARGRYTATVQCQGKRGDSIILEQFTDYYYVAVKDMKIHDYIHSFISMGKQK